MRIEQLKPLRDLVVIKRTEQEEKTEGGIIRPMESRTVNQTGMVLAVGQGRRNSNGDLIPVQVKPGDIVFFGTHSGTKIDDQHLILGEADILSTVDSIAL